MKYQLLISLCFLFFNTVQAQDAYFWVGGQGEWSEVNNWNLENGTTPDNLPNETNSVYFNENSFSQASDTVFINLNDPVCKNIIWENIPFEVVVFGDNENSELQIYGSLQFHANVKNVYHGLVRFKSGEEGNTITMNGNQLNHDVYFNGQGGEWTLMDDFTLSLNFADSVYRDIYLVEGALISNGKQIVCGAIISDNQFSRTLNIDNSNVTLHEEMDYCWHINMENLELLTDNSTIYIKGFLNKFITKNGEDIYFDNVYLQGNFDSIQNINNHVQYNYIQVDSNLCCIDGDYSIGSLKVYGEQFHLSGEPEIDYIRVGSGQVVIPEGVSIGKIISDGYVIFSGSNHVEFAKLSSKACFYGENIFDTLIITASYGIISGNWFCFESGKTQLVYDSLYIRGHPCENINIHATQFDSTAYLRKDYGNADISCDFLILANVGALSESLDFYTGVHSSFIPNPDEAPPGWIVDNGPGYMYGFGGSTNSEPCIGDTVIISTENFNGNDSTLYFWNNDNVPGEDYYLVTESGTINIMVFLAPGCFVADYATVVFDTCDNIINEEVNNQRILVYPIPTKGVLTIQTQNITDGFEIVLMNTQGAEVYREYIKPGSLDNLETFDFGNLNKGVYFLEIRAKNKGMNRKLILY